MFYYQPPNMYVYELRGPRARRRTRLDWKHITFFIGIYYILLINAKSVTNS